MFTRKIILISVFWLQKHWRLWAVRWNAHSQHRRPPLKKRALLGLCPHAFEKKDSIRRKVIQVNVHSRLSINNFRFLQTHFKHTGDCEQWGGNPYKQHEDLLKKRMQSYDPVQRRLKGRDSIRSKSNKVYFLPKSYYNLISAIGNCRCIRNFHSQQKEPLKIDSVMILKTYTLKRRGLNQK